MGNAVPLKALQILSADAVGLTGAGAGTTFAIADLSPATPAIAVDNLIAISYTNVQGTVTLTG